MIAFSFLCLIVVFIIILSELFEFGDISYLIVAVLTGIALYGINICVNSEKPTALDVYRGNTELKIIHKEDGIIDSIVVFKSTAVIIEECNDKDSI